jgi:hypothetical protein
MATINDVMARVKAVETKVNALRTSLAAAHEKLDKLLAPPATTPLPMAVFRLKAEKPDGTMEDVDLRQLAGTLAVAGGELTLEAKPEASNG